MSDDQSAGTVLAYSILNTMLEEALRERDEARMDLVASEELHRMRFGTLKAELAEARRQASVWEKLALREASINGARLCGKEEA